MANDANLRIVSVDYAPITDSKPRQVARPLQPLHIALIQLDIAVNRLDHPNAGGPVKPLQVAKRAIRIGRAFTQMPSSLFTSSEVWGSTGHAIRDPFFDRSQGLIAQFLPVQRQRRQGCAPGTSSPGQGFQNPRRNCGLGIRESINQIVELCSGRCLHRSNLAHPFRPDPMVAAGKRRRRTADDQSVTLRIREAHPA